MFNVSYSFALFNQRHVHINTNYYGTELFFINSSKISQTPIRFIQENITFLYSDGFLQIKLTKLSSETIWVILTTTLTNAAQEEVIGQGGLVIGYPLRLLHRYFTMFWLNMFLPVLLLLSSCHEPTQRLEWTCLSL